MSEIGEPSWVVTLGQPLLAATCHMASLEGEAGGMFLLIHSSAFTHACPRNWEEHVELQPLNDIESVTARDADGRVLYP